MAMLLWLVSIAQFLKSLELTCQGVMYKKQGYGCGDESFSLYLLLFTVCNPPCGFGFIARGVPPMSVSRFSLSNISITEGVFSCVCSLGYKIFRKMGVIRQKIV